METSAAPSHTICVPLDGKVFLWGEVVVPDLPASALMARVLRKLSYSHMAMGDEYDYPRRKHILAWDFYRGFGGQAIPGRGKRFQVLVWKRDMVPDWRLRMGLETPNTPVDRDFVRAYFQQKGGFAGSVGAFLAWCFVAEFDGHYVTLPEDYACHPGSSRHVPPARSGFYVPKALHVPGYDSSCLGFTERLYQQPGGPYSLVAFREVPR